MYEFLGPNFDFNGYCDAKYRSGDETIKIGEFDVPLRLEALRKGGEWSQFPSVFIHR